MKNVIVAILFAALLWPAMAPAAPPAPGTAAPERVSSQSQKLDLNRATREQLETVPGIGPRMAQSIVDLRTKKGAFRKIEDLLEVPGIKEKKLNALAAHLHLAVTTPGSAGLPGAPNAR